MPMPSQYSAQRWIVRRGPLIAAIGITAVVAAKVLSLISGVLDLRLAFTDFVGVLEAADHVSWPLAILLLLASWMTVFLGVPIWKKYLAYEARWRREEEDECGSEDSATRPSKGARRRKGSAKFQGQPRGLNRPPRPAPPESSSPERGGNRIRDFVGLL